MPTPATQVVVLTPEELTRLLERASQQAVERALEPVRRDVEALVEATQSVRGILTQDQACAFFRCNEDTIRRYRKEGLRYYRVGQQPFYRMEDIEAFIRARPEHLAENS